MTSVHAAQKRQLQGQSLQHSSYAPANQPQAARNSMASWRPRLRLPHPLAGVSIGLALLWVLLCLCAPLLTRFDPVAVDLGLGLQFPSSDHWLGTDSLGRDLWSRLLWAGRTSISVAGIVLSLTALVGTSIGLFSGYWGGMVDEMTMRLTELCDGLPQVIVALAILGAMGPSVPALVLALASTGWAQYARVARILVLRTRNAEYIVAATVIGTAPPQIIFCHLLPAALGLMAVNRGISAISSASVSHFSS